jgi:hypothetical protein
MSWERQPQAQRRSGLEALERRLRPWVLGNPGRPGVLADRGRLVDRGHPEDLADQHHPVDQDHPVDPGRLERPKVPLARQGLSAPVARQGLSAPEARRVLPPLASLRALRSLLTLRARLARRTGSPYFVPPDLSFANNATPLGRHKAYQAGAHHVAPGIDAIRSRNLRRRGSATHLGGESETRDGRERECDNSGQRQSARTLLTQVELRHPTRLHRCPIRARRGRAPR